MTVAFYREIVMIAQQLWSEDTAIKVANEAIPDFFRWIIDCDIEGELKSEHDKLREDKKVPVPDFEEWKKQRLSQDTLTGGRRKSVRPHAAHIEPSTVDKHTDEYLIIWLRECTFYVVYHCLCGMTTTVHGLSTTSLRSLSRAKF